MSVITKQFTKLLCKGDLIDEAPDYQCITIH
jgi:hypothetical protein